MYHVDTNTWSSVDTPHDLFTIAVVTGKIVIVGGRTRKNIATNKVLVLKSGLWEDYTEMPTARYKATAFSYQSKMIVMGGDTGMVFSTTELFDDMSGQWFKCDDLPQPLYFLQSVILGDTVYVLGGKNEIDKSSKAVYAASLNTLSTHQLKWQHLADTSCKDPAAVGLNNKYLLAVCEDDIYTLNSTTNTWMTIATLPELTMFTSVVSGDNSTLVMIGGSNTKVWIGSFQ